MAKPKHDRPIACEPLFAELVRHPVRPSCRYLPGYVGPTYTLKVGDTFTIDGKKWTIIRG